MIMLSIANLSPTNSLQIIMWLTHKGFIDLRFWLMEGVHECHPVVSTGIFWQGLCQLLCTSIVRDKITGLQVGIYRNSTKPEGPKIISKSKYPQCISDGRDTLQGRRCWEDFQSELEHQTRATHPQDEQRTTRGVFRVYGHNDAVPWAIPKDLQSCLTYR